MGRLLWNAARHWPFPTVFLEHKLLYGMVQDAAGYRELTPHPEDVGGSLFPTLVRQAAGADAAIVAYGGMVPVAEEARAAAQRERRVRNRHRRAGAIGAAAAARPGGGAAALSGGGDRGRNQHRRRRRRRDRWRRWRKPDIAAASAASARRRFQSPLPARWKPPSCPTPAEWRGRCWTRSRQPRRPTEHGEFRSPSRASTTTTTPSKVGAPGGRRRRGGRMKAT